MRKQRGLAAGIVALGPILIGCDSVTGSSEPPTPSEVRDELGCTQWTSAPIRQFYVKDRYLCRYDDLPLASVKGDWTHVTFFANNEGRDAWREMGDQFATNEVVNEGDSWVELRELPTFNPNYPPFEGNN